MGDDGSLISGGQKQRIAIARSIYHDKEILVFDEPFSSLDELNKINIIKTLKMLKKMKTIIIVSHDKEVFKICDYIYELKNKNLIKKNI